MTTDGISFLKHVPEETDMSLQKFKTFRATVLQDAGAEGQLLPSHSDIYCRHHGGVKPGAY